MQKIFLLALIRKNKQINYHKHFQKFKRGERLRFHVSSIDEICDEFKTSISMEKLADFMEPEQISHLLNGQQLKVMGAINYLSLR